MVEVMGESMNKELPFDHEPCINHWAILMADDDVETGRNINSMPHLSDYCNAQNAHIGIHLLL